MIAMEKTSLSIIVPAYNEAFLIEESLNRLCILEESPHLEKIQAFMMPILNTIRAE
jgi:hypothetical protein